MAKSYLIVFFQSIMADFFECFVQRIQIILIFNVCRVVSLNFFKFGYFPQNKKKNVEDREGEKINKQHNLFLQNQLATEVREERHSSNNHLTTNKKQTKSKHKDHKNKQTQHKIKTINFRCKQTNKQTQTKQKQINKNKQIKINNTSHTMRYHKNNKDDISTPSIQKDQILPNPIISKALSFHVVAIFQSWDKRKLNLPFFLNQKKKTNKHRNCGKAAVDQTVNDQVDHNGRNPPKCQNQVKRAIEKAKAKVRAKVRVRVKVVLAAIQRQNPKAKANQKSIKASQKTWAFRIFVCLEKKKNNGQENEDKEMFVFATTEVGDSSYANALRGASVPTYSIFVKNLTRSCTDEELLQLFAKYGSVYSAKVIRKKNNPTNKCFGFVNFTSKTAQKQALRDSGSSDLVLHGNLIECALSANTTVVYIGNLSRDSTISDIRYHIRKCGGPYMALHLRNGHAFVVYESYYRAEKAIDHLNGTTLGGCKLWVNIASEAKSKVIKQLMNGETEHANARSLFIGNLNHDITEEDLKDRFGKYGKVTDVRIPKIRPTGKSRGFAFIEFGNSGDAELAIRGEQGKKLLGQVCNMYLHSCIWYIWHICYIDINALYAYVSIYIIIATTLDSRMDISWCRDDPHVQMSDSYLDGSRPHARGVNPGLDYGSTVHVGELPPPYVMPLNQFPPYTPEVHSTRPGQNYPRMLKSFPLMEVPGKPGQYVHLVPAGYVAGRDGASSSLSPYTFPAPVFPVKHDLDTEFHNTSRKKDKHRHEKSKNHKQKHSKKSSHRKSNKHHSRNRSHSHSRSRDHSRSKSDESSSTGSSKSNKKSDTKTKEKKDREHEREKEKDREIKKHNKQKERGKRKEKNIETDKETNKKYRDNSIQHQNGEGDAENHQPNVIKPKRERSYSCSSD
ncbi:hypothetical protein RFI_13597 [Reticulomyxa filosa]|uniref:RRM domain-containing protein n=1 Tax=Reticulomyxa filosa TaxID=46433 RepID=X6NE09_RETFI|nr:hypothetical protein RFI_13597 [Reticulomyxa filosa]|eukprot:ETO23582.1 hypothetical protein RFI_13597 [Reticulomyxa filosa]